MAHRETLQGGRASCGVAAGPGLQGARSLRQTEREGVTGRGWLASSPEPSEEGRRRRSRDPTRRGPYPYAFSDSMGCV